MGQVIPGRDGRLSTRDRSFPGGTGHTSPEVICSKDVIWQLYNTRKSLKGSKISKGSTLGSGRSLFASAVSEVNSRQISADQFQLYLLSGKPEQFKETNHFLISLVLFMWVRRG